MAVVAEDRRTDEQRRGEENGCCVPAVQMSVTNAMPTPVVSQTVTSSKHGQSLLSTPAPADVFIAGTVTFVTNS